MKRRWRLGFDNLLCWLKILSYDRFICKQFFLDGSAVCCLHVKDEYGINRTVYMAIADIYRITRNRKILTDHFVSGIEYLLKVR